MKRGITVSVLAVAVAIMLIAVSTALVIGTSSIKTASYEEYMSKLKRVEDEVNIYEEEKGELPITGDIISKVGVDTDFLTALEVNGDSQNKLFIIDISSLALMNVNIGRGTSGNNDIFVLAENTNNVYYFAGMEYKGVKYFGVKR